MWEAAASTRTVFHYIGKGRERRKKSREEKEIKLCLVAALHD